MAQLRGFTKAGEPLGTRVRIPKAAEIVSSKLRSLIIREELTDGASLPSEAELINQFGVSRPTLREAIRILESEGLVTVMRGAKGGAIVHRPNLELVIRSLGLLLQFEGVSIGEIYRVHAFLEVPAARLVAELRNQDAISELRACLAEARNHVENDSLFGADTARFRNTLVKHSGITTLVKLASVLNDILERSWSSVTVTAGSQVNNRRAKQRGMKSIETLIALIEAGNGAEAEDHWRRHTLKAEATMREWLDTTKVVDLFDK